MAEASLWVISAHIAFVSAIYGGKRLVNRLVERLRQLRPSSFAREQTP
jgi:hypothetical protein